MKLPHASYKLSKLQKQILALALANRVKEGRTDDSEGADLYNSQVLADVYGLEALEPERWPEDWKQYGDARAGQRRPRRGFFSREIGPAYNRAHAAVTRAMLRLEARGLLRRFIYSRMELKYCSGIRLTALGVERQTVKCRLISN